MRPSRYPRFDVLAKRSSPDWDEQTRAVVRRRLEQVPESRFLDEGEARTLQSVVARIVPQPDRPSPVPIAPWIDEKLVRDGRDGYRYDGMPPLRECWRIGIAGINETSRTLFGGTPFHELNSSQQNTVLQRVQNGDPPGAAWERLPARRFFRDVLCLTVVRIYYAHPAAWSEIGYSGPAAVRGHVRNWEAGVDPWDAPEAR